MHHQTRLFTCNVPLGPSGADSLKRGGRLPVLDDNNHITNDALGPR